LEEAAGDDKKNYQTCILKSFIALPRETVQSERKRGLMAITYLKKKSHPFRKIDSLKITVIVLIIKSFLKREREEKREREREERNNEH